MQHYLDAIRQWVCPECEYGILGRDRKFFLCGLPEGRECAIKRFLPQVVEISEGIQGACKENYIVALRNKVCSCCDQFACGSCPLTGFGQCTLNSHFLDVVEVVKQINLQTRIDEKPLLHF